MNASEQLLAELVEVEGWASFPCYRVEITAAEKRKIGQLTLPTPEIDVVAIKHDRVAWVESKTYMDSRGVQAKTLADGYSGPGRVRVFNDPTYRKVVTGALLRQLRANGSIGDTDPIVEYWFAAWKFSNKKSEKAARALFDEKGWRLLGPPWFLAQLQRLAETSYRDSTAALVAKLLLRNPPTQPG